MIPNLVRLLTGRPAPDVERSAFVEHTQVADRESPNPAVERLILVCWILIAIKHVTVIWAVHHYAVPFNQLWVNFPTWLLGVLASGIYYWRVGRR